MQITENNPLENQEIIFPVTYVLKVVVTQNMSAEHHQSLIEELLSREKVPFRFIDVKHSGKGTYLSFSFQVTLTDRAHMTALYVALRGLPWIKMAI